MCTQISASAPVWLPSSDFIAEQLKPTILGGTGNNFVAFTVLRYAIGARTSGDGIFTTVFGDALLPADR